LKRPESIADLERALTLRQDDPDAPILLAETYLQTNDLAAARTALDRHLARSADDLDARYQRGLIALGLGHLQAAAKDFTRGLEADPARTEIRYRRAQTWLRLGRFQDALTDIDMLIRSYPEYAPALERPGETHESLGHDEEALADLKRAGEMPSGDPAQANNLAWKLATGPPLLRDPKLALSLARKATEEAPGTAVYLNTLGVAQYGAGRYAEAVTTLEKSLAAGKGRSDAFDLFFLAMARHKLGQAARARASFDRALLWRRDHQDLLGGQSSAELDGFQAEAQAILDGPLPELPGDVFAPEDGTW
jgi:tetratricopeptide (TPR) repeat protein